MIVLLTVINCAAYYSIISFYFNYFLYIFRIMEIFLFFQLVIVSGKKENRKKQQFRVPNTQHSVFFVV